MKNKNTHQKVVEAIPNVIRDEEKVMKIFNDIVVNNPEIFLKSYQRVKKTFVDERENLSEPVAFFVDELEKMHGRVINLKDAKGIVDLAVTRNKIKAIHKLREITDLKHRDAYPLMNTLIEKYSEVSK